jgi:serine protease Do
MLSSLRIAALAGGITVAVLALTIQLVTTLRANAANTPPMNLKVDNAPPPREGRMNSYSSIVKRVAPSVVRVDTSAKVRAPRMQLPPGFEDFMPFLAPYGGNQQQYYQRQGLGSGVIVTKDGYILSNNHVVDGADDIKITLSDDREFKAKVVGRDPKTDIAVLKVDAKDLPAIDIANSDNIEVGDVVLAVGNPFGIGQTVTMGIVSATGRSGLGIEDLEDFIQTDAAINPGNSGGALVDVQGRLIGINAAILSRTGGNQGIGFAVPINLARTVSDSLITNGKVVRGFLGVRPQNLTSALARQFEVKQNSGVLLAEITPDSPAEKAGLKNGDVVTEIDGKPVRDANQFFVVIAQKPPGSKVNLTVYRDGSKRTVEASLREREASDDVVAGSSGAPQTTTENLQGVTVADLDQNTRGQYRVPAELKGALVVEVDQNSIAFQAGLRQGDVILEINRKRVASAAEAVKLTENQSSKSTLLRVWSRGMTRYLLVDESKSE